MIWNQNHGYQHLNPDKWQSRIGDFHYLYQSIQILQPHHLVYKNTNVPNKRIVDQEVKQSQIDIYLTKNLDDGNEKFIQEPGDSGCQNDGHDILNGTFNVETCYDKKNDDELIFQVFFSVNKN